MEEKDTYEFKEFERGIIEAVITYDGYLELKKEYDFINSEAATHVYPKISSEKVKETLNLSVDDCNKKLPKSLIDQFEIKKIE